MTRYIIDIEYSDHPGEHPINCYIRKVNVDPKGYEIGEAHGKSMRAVLLKVVKVIENQES